MSWATPPGTHVLHVSNDTMARLEEFRRTYSSGSAPDDVIIGSLLRIADLHAHRVFYPNKQES